MSHFGCTRVLAWLAGARGRRDITQKSVRSGAKNPPSKRSDELRLSACPEFSTLGVAEFMRSIGEGWPIICLTSVRHPLSEAGGHLIAISRVGRWSTDQRAKGTSHESQPAREWPV